jgi:hypothetical protein
MKPAGCYKKDAYAIMTVGGVCILFGVASGVRNLNRDDQDK